MNKTSEEKICVAICNYKHEDFLSESIKSILEQDYENLDVVIVDDGSPSNLSRDIAYSFNDSRIRFHRFSENIGKWNCLNYAFSSTNAKFCTSHDADDISLSWRLSTQMSTLKTTKTIHNLCGFVHCFSENDIQKNLNTKMPQSIKFMGSQDVFRFVDIGFRTNGCNHLYTGDFETAGTSALFLREIWSRGFRFNPPDLGLRILHSEDSDFNCRVILSTGCSSILLEKPYLYRRGTSTNMEKR